jgi:hypothetical protein
MSKELQIFKNEDVKEMAKSLGPLFGKEPRDMFALMLIAQAEGKHPATAAQEYDVIQGKPAINSKAALARFQSSGGSINWITRTDAEASAKFSHPQGGELVITWTMERAKKAQLTGKQNWQKYPAQMLSARVIAEGVRAVFPACLSGLYTVDEVRDFDTRNVTPEASKPDPVEMVEKIFSKPADEGFVDDIPELKEEKKIVKGGLFTDAEVAPNYQEALEVFSQGVEGQPAENIKKYIIEWAAVQDDNVQKEVVKILQSIKGADKLEQLIGYIDIYLMHPDVIGCVTGEMSLSEVVKDAKESNDPARIYKQLVECYEVCNG